MLQSIIAWTIIVAGVALAGRHIFRLIAGGNNGCAKCPMSKICNRRTR